MHFRSNASFSFRPLQTAADESKHRVLSSTPRFDDVTRYICGVFGEQSNFLLRGSMAEGEENLTGMAKYFNSITPRGRANVAKATYAGVALIALYFYLKPKSKKT